MVEVWLGEAGAAARLRQMQYRPGLLEGFLAKTGLDLAPP